MRILLAFVAGLLLGAVGLAAVWRQVGLPGPMSAATATATAAPATATAPAAAAEPAEPPDVPPDALRPPPDPFTGFEPPLAPAASLVPGPPADLSDLEWLAARKPVLPVPGFDRARLRDTFSELRGGRVHEAIDLMAPRGTPVVAVDDGVVKRLFLSVRGGLTVYQFDPSGRYCYYYAHLDQYAEGLEEGMAVRKGDLLGTVGSTGNAAPAAPHLHFTIFKLGPTRRWSEGTPVNPFPLWALPG